MSDNNEVEKGQIEAGFLQDGEYSEIVDGVTWRYKMQAGKVGIIKQNEKSEGNLTIPSVLGGHRVTSIGDSAFDGCWGFTSVTIPDSVTSISRGAFYGCTGLTSVTIPDSVKFIGANAFTGCTGLGLLTRIRLMLRSWL